MGKSAGIIYRPREDATPEAELDALAGVYRFILDRHADRHAKKMAAERAPAPDGRDAATRVEKK